MQEFARAAGFLSLISGAFLLVFPTAARRLMETRHEFTRLSPGALRLLGGWELLTGVLLVWPTVSRAASARVEEVALPERRMAA